MARSRSQLAVTVRCITCNLELTGVLHAASGLVYPSDRSRPEPDARVVPGYCLEHAPVTLGIVKPEPRSRMAIKQCTICGEDYAPGTYGRHIRARYDLHQQVRRDALRGEVAKLARPRSDHKVDRNAAIVAAVIGPPRRSYGSVAIEFGVTRARVGQVVQRAGYGRANLPKLPPAPPAPKKQVPCTVCGEPYTDGEYPAHIRATGHRNAPSRYLVSNEQAAAMAARVAAGEPWAAVSDMPRGNFAKVLIRGGHRGDGWVPKNVERNLEIARRFFVDRETAASIVEAMGLPNRAMVFNVTGAVRAVGGMEHIDRLMPRPRTESVGRQNRRRQAEPRYAEVRRRLKAGERPAAVARALGISPATVYKARRTPAKES